MKRLAASPAWHVDGGRDGPCSVDARIVPLLAAIGSEGSLTAAARVTGLPYRTAWALLEAAERSLGAPLATLSRGRGATLTSLSRRWLAAHDAARSVLAQAPSIDVAPARDAKAAHRAAAPLKVAASHDIALAQLRDRWRLIHGVALEFHGSGESLDAYRAGRVDVAGFHAPHGAVAAADPLLSRLRPGQDALLRFLARTQGLILPRGNPRRVHTLADLAAKRLRIVNRQPGSGTRMLLDRLLERAGIAPATLEGYTNEEFTHAAVAATVAAGNADAGFGIEAAAAQFGLAFVPLAPERYRFVCRQRALESERIVAFRKLIASPATRAVVRHLPGYRLDAPGSVERLD
jgi:molybdate transport repressor ModE-like protein